NLFLDLNISDEQDQSSLYTDGNLLIKTISCLLDNAIKFTNHGSVSFGYYVNGGTIFFFVNDTGVGVSAESRELIFDPFVQEETTSTRGYEGSGLGLYIVKSYLKLLGGEMCLETIKGKGTQVLFSLPMEQRLKW
ncbi:MAG: ATP-binding protein, partial [Spirochaetota bacterium]